MTREDLKAIRNIDKLIVALIQDAMNLRSKVESVQTVCPKEDVVQTSGVGDPMKAVDRLIDLEASIDKEVDKFVNLRLAALREFSKLETRERLLMELRYIQYKDWEDIAEALNRDVRHVYRIHETILEKFF